MSPQTFAATYRPTADQVSAGTGIDPMVLLAQWANETAWGQVVVGNNLGNIRCSPTSFCQYASLADFAVACIATFHNGFYDPVLAAQTAPEQLAAICASPWDAGHYGGSLDAYYLPLEDFEMTPDERAALFSIQTKQQVSFGDLWSNPTWPNLVLVLDAVKAVSAAIAALPAASGGLTALQAQALADIHDAAAQIDATVTRIEAALKTA